MCCLLKTEERQWLPSTPSGALCRLSCAAMTWTLTSCWVSPAAPQSCFLELTAFPRGSSHKPVPGTYREKVKEWYKSHLEVPWQLKRGSGVLMWNHKWRKGPQGLLKPLTVLVTQGWHRGWCCDSLALAECAALEQINRGPACAQSTRADLSPPVSKDSKQQTGAAREEGWDAGYPETPGFSPSRG